MPALRPRNLFPPKIERGRATFGRYGLGMTDGQPIARELVTTLPQLPGYVIVAAHGIVADIGTGSGKTGRAKALTAFGDALDGVLRSAESKGGNAIVGLQIAHFGTSMGGMLGDAVGATLMGTAVTVEPA